MPKNTTAEAKLERDLLTGLRTLRRLTGQDVPGEVATIARQLADWQRQGKRWRWAASSRVDTRTVQLVPQVIEPDTTDPQ